MSELRKLNLFSKLIALFAGAVILSVGSTVRAQEPRELRIAYFVPAVHNMGVFLGEWAKELEQKSGGRLTFSIFPAAQLGPTPNYYDIARRGQADITWILHGATPNRFPLAEISNLPFMFCSGEHATKVINNPELRSKYLDAEHQGVKVLNIHAHVPGHLWLSKDSVNSLDDIGGKAIRPPSRATSAFVSALGAKPVGLPPEQLAEGMGKGTIDGTFMDYSAGLASFKLGPVSKQIVEMYSYTTSFSLIMNQGSWDRLPADLKKLIETSLEGREKDIGGGWDRLNDKAKVALAKDGLNISRLPAAEMAKLKQAGDAVSKKWVADLDEKGLPGTEVFNLMKKLADETKASSANFCEN